MIELIFVILEYLYPPLSCHCFTHGKYGTAAALHLTLLSAFLIKFLWKMCLCINFLLALLFVSQLLWTATGATIRSDTRHQTRTNSLGIKTYHEHTQPRNYCLEHTNDGPKHPRHEYFVNGVCLPQVETGKKWILKTGAYMLKRP